MGKPTYTIGVCIRILAAGLTNHTDIVDDYLRRVCHEEVIGGGLSPVVIGLKLGQNAFTAAMMIEINLIDIQIEIGNCRLVQSFDADQSRAEGCVVLSIEVVPHLTVAIDGAAAVHSDVVTTPKPEACRILEDKLKAVFLPVGSVVGEQDGALDIWRIGK